MDQHLNFIADYLLENDIDTSGAGLLYGKIGVAVFFFHYARYCNNEKYEDHAINLVEKTQKQMLFMTSTDYDRGLTGIGTAIEYLEQNNFVEADTNEILEDSDRKISHAVVYNNHTDTSLFSGLSGLGKYLLSRISGRYADDNLVSTLNNKILLIHITDILEQKLSLKESDDVLRFLYELEQKHIYPAKVKRLLNQSSCNTQLIDIQNRHKQNIDILYKTKYDEFISGYPKGHYTMPPGLYGGLAGLGLFLLSMLDKRHISWKELL